jgi:hypothetical protein
VSWQQILVTLPDGSAIHVEGREKGSCAEWRGLPGTTFNEWFGGGPRTIESLADQVASAAVEWFERRQRTRSAARMLGNGGPLGASVIAAAGMSPGRHCQAGR